MIKLDGCDVDETPALTRIEGGGVVASCSVLTLSDLRQIARHNVGVEARCALRRE